MSNKADGDSASAARVRELAAELVRRMARLETQGAPPGAWAQELRSMAGRFEALTRRRKEHA
jgi:hypothetical protein